MCNCNALLLHGPSQQACTHSSPVLPGTPCYLRPHAGSARAPFAERLGVPDHLARPGAPRCPSAARARQKIEYSSCRACCSTSAGAPTCRYSWCPFSSIPWLTWPLGTSWSRSLTRKGATTGNVVRLKTDLAKRQRVPDVQRVAIRATGPAPVPDERLTLASIAETG